MNRADNDFDFTLYFIGKVQEIDKKYDISPDAVFEIQCEIATAAYILVADDADYQQLDIQMETLKQSYSGTIPYTLIYNAVKGLLIQLKAKGVTKENVYEYMERRIAEFEDAAKAKRPDAPPNHIPHSA